MAWVAAAVVGAGALGAGATIWGANKASEAQQNATDRAYDINNSNLALTREINAQNQGNLAPFRQLGESAANNLGNFVNPVVYEAPTFEAPTFNAPATFRLPTAEEARATPGYEFIEKQGLKATQNSATARGLGVSGAALKGAATFATGLADATYQHRVDNENLRYQNEFQKAVQDYNARFQGAKTVYDTKFQGGQQTFANTVANQSNAFTRLKSLIDTGASAAGAGATSGNQSASIGTAGANYVAGNVLSSGNAQATGYNTMAGGVNKFANDVGGYAAYKGLYGDTTNGLQPLFNTQAAYTRGEG